MLILKKIKLLLWGKCRKLKVQNLFEGNRQFYVEEERSIVLERKMQVVC